MNLLNIVQKTRVKSIFILLMLLILYIFVSAFFYVEAVSEDISNSVFRLHVIANSDEKEDQDLKYKVRDSVLEYMNSIVKDCSSKEEIIKLVEKHKQDFYNVAKKVIKENGYNYDVNIYIGKFDFPTKQYGDISFPAGNYDSLRIQIGKAKGKNWWCVMFPPLCFVDVTSGVVPDESKEIIKDSLTSEEYNIINNSNTRADIKFKFSIIEAFEGLKIADK